MIIVTISTYYPLFDDNHYQIYVLSSVRWQSLPCLRILRILCLMTIVAISTYILSSASWQLVGYISTYCLLFDDNRHHIYVQSSVWRQWLPCLPIVFCLMIIVTISIIYLLSPVWWQSLPYVPIVFGLMTIVTISTCSLLFDDNAYHIYLLSSVWWQ